VRPDAHSSRYLAELDGTRLTISHAGARVGHGLFVDGVLVRLVSTVPLDRHEVDVAIVVCVQRAGRVARRELRGAA